MGWSDVQSAALDGMERRCCVGFFSDIFFLVPASVGYWYMVRVGGISLGKVLSAKGTILKDTCSWQLNPLRQRLI